MDVVELLGAPRCYAEAGHHFVEDEERIVLRGDGAQGFEKTWYGWDAAHVAADWFHDYGCYFRAVILEGLFDRFRVVERQRDGGVAEAFGHARRIGQP